MNTEKTAQQRSEEIKAEVNAKLAQAIQMAVLLGELEIPTAAVNTKFTMGMESQGSQPDRARLMWRSASMTLPRNAKNPLTTAKTKTTGDALARMLGSLSGTGRKYTVRAGSTMAECHTGAKLGIPGDANKYAHAYGFLDITFVD